MIQNPSIHELDLWQDLKTTFYCWDTILKKANCSSFMDWFIVCHNRLPTKIILDVPKKNLMNLDFKYLDLLVIIIHHCKSNLWLWGTSCAWVVLRGGRRKYSRLKLHLDDAATTSFNRSFTIWKGFHISIVWISVQPGPFGKQPDKTSPRLHCLENRGTCEPDENGVKLIS